MEDAQIRFIAGLAVFITIVSIMSFTFGFADEVSYIFPEDESGNPQTPEQVDFDADDSPDDEGWWSGVVDWFGSIGEVIKSVPLIGQVWILLEWIWAGVLMFLFFLGGTFLPDTMPFIIKAIIMTPIYVLLLMALIPTFSRIVEAIGNVIVGT